MQEARRCMRANFVWPFVVIALAASVSACAQGPSAVPDAAHPSAYETFHGTKSEIIRLAIRAIQAKGWKLDQVNESVGVVSFETPMSLGSWSGISANLIVEESGPNIWRVSGTAKQNLKGGQIAAFDIGGEAQNVVRDAIAEMRALSTQ